jgi:P-type Ca2+ transporter type 2C
MSANSSAAQRNPSPVIPIHTAVRGRARFRVAGLRHSRAMKQLLENNLSRARGIKEVGANPLTGNVLVTFDSSHHVERIAAMIVRTLNAHAGSNGYALCADPEPSADSGYAAPANHESSHALAKDWEPRAWHTIDAERAIAQIGSSLASGLSSSTAAKRLADYGSNVLPDSAVRSKLAILLDQITSTPILLLIAAAGTSILTGGMIDAAVILGVVGLNAAIGFTTENQSERTIHSLKTVMSPSAEVLRDGQRRKIPGRDVTVGDILVLTPGSYVAADGRLLEVDRLSIDESTLTGESVPVSKIADKLASADLPLADRLNMVYMGTLVTGGQGLALVIATGRYTEIGRIQMLTAQAEAPQTPMQRQLDHMGHQLVLGVGAVCVVVFGIGVLRGYPLLSMMQTAIALAVAAVPEGLPTIATTILALGIVRMRNLHALVRRLDAVETLGCVQAICLDKTGTLTLNRMSVVAAQLNGRSFKVSDGQFREQGRKIDSASIPELNRLLEVCVLCSETVIEKGDSGYVLKGSPTENALIYMAIAAHLSVSELRRRNPALRVRLRSDERAFMSTVHRVAVPDGGAKFLTMVKGSPTQVLAMCSSQYRHGESVELTNEDQRAIETENERMAGNALRVLGCAYREDEREPRNGEDEAGLVWLGLIGLADPIRSGVTEVIRGFHDAGIDTVMITGDQSPTAYAIGSELGVSRNGPLQILDSTHLANVDSDVLKALAERIHVFARVSPAHKLQIVQALQRANKVVAMTGDGINDSPALKAADIGIAMGSTGTDVAREAADIVLEDDQLATMLVAVSQGRTIYANIRKSVHFLLSTNFSEVIVMFAAMTVGLGQPLTAMQLLWINLVSETSLGLAIALDPPEAGIMEQPPRDPNEPIIRPQDFKRMGFEALTLSAGSLGAYGYGVARYGIGPRASTLGFTSLVSGQILHALSSRSEKQSIFDWPPRQPNHILSLTVAGSLALQAAVFAIPFLRNLLGIASISLVDSLVMGAGAAVPLLVNEGAKVFSSQQISAQPPATHSEQRN